MRADPGGVIGASQQAKDIAIYLLIAAGYGLAGYWYYRVEKRRVANARVEGVEVAARVFKPTQKVCFGLVVSLCLFALQQSFEWGSGGDFGWLLFAILMGWVAAFWASLLFGGLLISLVAGRRVKWKARIGVWVVLAAVVGLVAPVAFSNGPMKARFFVRQSAFDRLALELKQVCKSEARNHPNEADFTLQAPFSRRVNGPVDVKEIRCAVAMPDTVEFQAGTSSSFLSSERFGFSTRRPENIPGDTRNDLALSGGWWYWTEYSGF